MRMRGVYLEEQRCEIIWRGQKGKFILYKHL
jgi:hypothetical protein